MVHGKYINGKCTYPYPLRGLPLSKGEKQLAQVRNSTESAAADGEIIAADGMGGALYLERGRGAMGEMGVLW